MDNISYSQNRTGYQEQIDSGTRRKKISKKINQGTHGKQHKHHPSLEIVCQKQTDIKKYSRETVSKVINCDE